MKEIRHMDCDICEFATWDCEVIDGRKDLRWWVDACVHGEMPDEETGRCEKFKLVEES